jgi:hypothetical protein
MTSIEEHLLQDGGWVSAAELARLFNVTERDLRTRNEKPGICSDFAISGNCGFKHIRHATHAEWTHFESRMRSHAISELVRVKSLRAARHRQTASTPQHIFETTTGQGLLLTL